MRILARLILSLEKLVKNPVSWFDNQPWLFRLFLVILFIPLISVVSIFSYQKFYLNESGMDSQNSHLELGQEINKLREESKKLHDSQMEKLLLLGEDVTQLKNEDLVLGVENSNPDEVDDGLVYIREDVKQVDVFLEPSTSSQSISTLEPGSFYPELAEEGEWQQIYLGEGKLGWIEKQFIIKSSTNEKR